MFSEPASAGLSVPARLSGIHRAHFSLQWPPHAVRAEGNHGQRERAATKTKPDGKSVKTNVSSLTTNHGLSRHSQRDVAQTAHVGRCRQLNKTAQRQYRQSRVTSCRRQTRRDSSPLSLLAGTLGVASQCAGCRPNPRRCLRQSKEVCVGGEGGVCVDTRTDSCTSMKPSYPA